MTSMWILRESDVPSLSLLMTFFILFWILTLLWPQCPNIGLSIFKWLNLAKKQLFRSFFFLFLLDVAIEIFYHSQKLNYDFSCIVFIHIPHEVITLKRHYDHFKVISSLQLSTHLEYLQHRSNFQHFLF